MEAREESAPNTADLADLLAHSPGQRVAELARQLDLSRREIAAALHYSETLFTKNARNEWFLADLTDLAVETAVSASKDVASKTEEAIYLEDGDLVERLKDLLNSSKPLKLSAISEALSEPRGVINGKLNSFSEVFVKNTVNEWSIRAGYVDNTVGPDADFSINDPQNEARAQLPSTEFHEVSFSSQSRVIEARLDQNFLVLAPPGTGKTHTLVERLVSCISSSSRDVDPGELLVLSFTRAAVGEIRERLAKAIEAGAPRALRYVRVYTFDAYASWILDDSDHDFRSLSYDDRISLLESKLQSDKLNQATGRIAKSKHLFVDEIQDLVSLRADLVLQLMRRILAVHGTVTLLGDPSQSLNDYQVRNQGEEATTSDEFLNKVHILLGEQLTEIELEQSHRFVTPEMKAIAKSAQEIISSTSTPAEQKVIELTELLPTSDLAELAEQQQDNSDVALLCRSNAEVFQWYEWCNASRIQCRIAEGSKGRIWPGWLAQGLLGYQAQKITPDQFWQRLQLQDRKYGAPDIEAFDCLLESEKLVHGGVISLDSLAQKIRYQAPIQGLSAEGGELVISTVHKAKGLGYDKVFLAEPKFSRNESLEEGARIIYVSITRAKKVAALIRREDFPFTKRISYQKGTRRLKSAGDNGEKFLYVDGSEDFNLDTLFLGGENEFFVQDLENYILAHQEEHAYRIRPEAVHGENKHSYALFLESSLGPIRLCAVSQNLNQSLDQMSWGNSYGLAGGSIDLSGVDEYCSVVLPLSFPVFRRYVGPSGILPIPNVKGFFALCQSDQ